MFRRNFIKAMLSGPLALLGGKDEELVVETPDGYEAERWAWYVDHNEEDKIIEFPEGRWKLKQIVFTRVKEV